MAAKTTPKPQTDALAAQIRHLDGCPAERTEAYPAQRTDRDGSAAITVARCVDCGESTVE